MKIALGKKLRELRQKTNVTQEMLANALGVTSQAVSRWEADGSYPDMELIPSIANYFGITIDELFGYESDRNQKIDTLADKIQEMNRKNAGVDVCIDECVALARESVAEFPGNEKLIFCLASVLCNAGYVRYKEHHLTDKDGYDIYDTERHKTYWEWKEAIKLHESVLETAEDADLRQEATKELMQLYVNCGYSEKAKNLADSAPPLGCSKEMLYIHACDGKSRAKAISEALDKCITTASYLMILSVLVNEMWDEKTKVSVIENAIDLYDMIYKNEDYGLNHEEISYRYLYLSEHLWLTGDKDGAFQALDKALAYAKRQEAYIGNDKAVFTSPLVCQLKINPKGKKDLCYAKELPESFPAWSDADSAKVKKEIQKDPRWDIWVKKTKA